VQKKKKKKGELAAILFLIWFSPSPSPWLKLDIPGGGAWHDPTKPQGATEFMQMALSA